MCRRQPGRRGANDGLRCGAANAAAARAGCADGPRRRPRAAAAGRGPPGRAGAAKLMECCSASCRASRGTSARPRRGSTRTSIESPTLCALTIAETWSNESIGLPSIAVMMSPGCRPGGLGRAARRHVGDLGAAGRDPAGRRRPPGRQGRRARRSCPARASGRRCAACSTGRRSRCRRCRRGAAAGLDLRVDADDAAGVVEQRAAGVAGVDRRVGLDRLVDLEAVGRLDAAPEAGDDALGRGAVEAERVADGDRVVADLHAARVGERQRLGGLRARRPAGCGRRRGHSTRRDRGRCRRDRCRWRRSGRSTCLAVSTTCALVTIVCVLSIRKPVPEPALVRIDTTAGTAFA